MHMWRRWWPRGAPRSILQATTKNGWLSLKEMILRKSPRGPRAAWSSWLPSRPSKSCQSRIVDSSSLGGHCDHLQRRTLRSLFGLVEDNNSPQILCDNHIIALSVHCCHRHHDSFPYILLHFVQAPQQLCILCIIHLVRDFKKKYLSNLCPPLYLALVWFSPHTTPPSPSLPSLKFSPK